jgi:hypothetical protein
MNSRYYVQPLTEQVFVIRERVSVHGGPGPNDRIVRSFSVRHDAYMYVKELNMVGKEQSMLTGKR